MSSCKRGVWATTWLKYSAGPRAALLKAVSVVRNLGYPLRNFTTVNFDFLQHYRPSVNVVKRPHANAGGKGYALTGHHEIMIPLLFAAVTEELANSKSEARIPQQIPRE